MPILAPGVRRLSEEQRQLVAANLGLAARAAQKFEARYPLLAQAMGGFEDLVSVAMIGLVGAAMKFDPTIARFSTFGVRLAFHHLQRESQKCGHIRIPAWVQGERRAALVRTLTPLSLENLLSDPAGRDLEPLDRADESLEAERRALIAAIRKLPNRLRRVLALRRKGRTLEQIGERVGLTKERVRQLANQAIRQVQAELRREGWDVPETKTPPAKASGAG